MGRNRVAGTSVVNENHRRKWSGVRQVADKNLDDFGRRQHEFVFDPGETIPCEWLADQGDGRSTHQELEAEIKVLYPQRLATDGPAFIVAAEFGHEAPRLERGATSTSSPKLRIRPTTCSWNGRSTALAPV